MALVNWTSSQEPIPRKLPAMVYVGGKFVQRYNISGTRFWVHCVWEVTRNFPHGHSAITRLEGNAGWFGRVGTRRLPEDAYKLPLGAGRVAACDRHRQFQNEEAFALILEAYPHLVALLKRDVRETLGENPESAMEGSCAEIVSFE